MNSSFNATLSNVCTYYDIDVYAQVNLFLLFVLMTTIGMTVRFSEIRNDLYRPKGLAIGLGYHFILLPAIGYGLASTPGVITPFAVGLVAVSVAPGGAFANFLALVFQADIPLAVLILTLSAILSMGLLPLNLYFYLELTGLALNLCINVTYIALTAAMIFSGVVVGMVARHRLGFRTLEVLMVIGGLAGTAIGLMAFFHNTTSTVPVWTTPLHVIGLIVSLPFIGTAFGVVAGLAAGVDKPSVVTLGLECGIQNKLVAISCISVLLTGVARDQALSVAIIYDTVVGLVSLVWSIVAWKCLGWTNLKRSDSLWESFKRIRTNLKNAPEEALGVSPLASADAARVSTEMEKPVSNATPQAAYMKEAA